MAKRPLKVFRMAAGFYDAVVAAPSQAAALRAWETSTDLFKAGRAAETDDEDLKAEALAKPGEVIRKMRGDKAAMLGPKPAERFMPRVDAAQPAPHREVKPKRAVARGKPKKAAPKPPDRSKLDAAERALADAEKALATALGEVAIERADLDRREREARRAGEREVDAKRREKDRAEAAYQKAAAAANDNRT